MTTKTGPFPAGVDASPTLRRWYVLAAFSGVALVSQMLWLNFAPLLTAIQTRYGVTELEASLLVLVFPALYVVLSIPAGVMIDRLGYRFTVGLGALVMAVFALVRVNDATFGWLLVGQLGIAVAQPFVVNGISKLVVDWFPEDLGAIATGIGTMGMFLGMALGLALTPPLAEEFGLRGAMLVFAGIAVLAAAFFLLLVRPNPARAHIVDPERAGLGPILRQPKLLLVFILAFLGLGVFNGLTTWLEAILAPNDIDAVRAGLVGGALILGGIVGSVVIPALSDHFRRRKPFLFLAVLCGLLTVYPLGTLRSYEGLLAVALAQGFLFLPAFALLLEMCSELAGEVHAGAATGLLMLAGNAGGVVMILAMAAVKTEAVQAEASRGAAVTGAVATASFYPAVLLLVAVLAGTLVLVLFAPETFVSDASAGARERDGAS